MYHSKQTTRFSKPFLLFSLILVFNIIITLPSHAFRTLDLFGITKIPVTKKGDVSFSITEEDKKGHKIIYINNLMMNEKLTNELTIAIAQFLNVQTFRIIQSSIDPPQMQILTDNTAPLNISGNGENLVIATNKEYALYNNKPMNKINTPDILPDLKENKVGHFSFFNKKQQDPPTLHKKMEKPLQQKEPQSLPQKQQPQKQKPPQDKINPPFASYKIFQDPEKDADSWLKYSAQDPKTAYFNLGLFYQSNNNLDESLKYYHLADKTGFNPYIKVYLAQALYNKGQEREAEEILNKLIEWDKTFFPAHYFLARLKHSQNNISQAKESYKQVLLINPSDVNARYHLATLLTATRNFEAAKREFNLVLMHDPDHSTTKNYLSFIALNQNNIKEGLNHLKSSISWYQLNDLAALLLQENNIEEALHVYETSVILNNSNIKALYGIASIYQLKQNFEKAVEYYQKVLKLDDRYYDAYYNIGLCNIELGKTKPAIANLKKYLEAHPQDTNAVIKIIEKLQTKTDS